MILSKAPAHVFLWDWVGNTLVYTMPGGVLMAHDMSTHTSRLLYTFPGNIIRLFAFQRVPRLCVEVSFKDETHEGIVDIENPSWPPTRLNVRVRGSRGRRHAPYTHAKWTITRSIDELRVEEAVGRLLI